MRTVAAAVASALVLSGALLAAPAGAAEGPVFHDTGAPQPGGGPTGARFPSNVGGTYVPVPMRCGSERRVIWYAPGPASDSLWRNLDFRRSGSVGFTDVAVGIAGTYQPKVGDFDGDGCEDVLWYAAGPTNDAIWYFAPDGTYVSTTLTGSESRTPLVGNFDAVPATDEVFWYGPGAVAESIWTARVTNGSVVRGVFDDRSAPQVGGTYSPVVISKYSAVLWYAPGAAADYLWLGVAAGTTTAQSATTSIGGAYTPRPAGSSALMWTPATGGIDMLRPGVDWEKAPPPSSVTALLTPGKVEPFSVLAEPGGRTGFTVLHQPGAGADWFLVPEDRPDVASVSASVATLSTDGSTCAVVGFSGHVSCWGFGYGAGGAASGVPRRITGITGAVQVATSRSFGCAVRNDGRVLCWGANGYGQLGRGTTSASAGDAQPVAGVSDAAEVGVGRDFACARVGVRGPDGVRCWGRNQVGQLGADSTATQSANAVAVVDPTVSSAFGQVVDLAVGAAHACAVATGKVYCWGGGASGQLGNGTTTAAARKPVLATFCVDLFCRTTPFRTVAAGDAHSCATDSIGTRCWGSDAGGQLGNGTGPVSTSRPVPVLGLAVNSGALLSAGRDRTCAVSGAFQLRCWGSNTAGALGTGGAATSGVPPTLVPGPTWLSVSVGGQHSCGVKRTIGPATDLYCWGQGGAGQLGRGSNFRSSPTPQVLGDFGSLDA